MKSLLDYLAAPPWYRAAQVHGWPRTGGGPFSIENVQQKKARPSANSGRASCFERILVRLLNDQEKFPHPYHGQFGRDRDFGTRSATQRDHEPLDKKPEFLMTFTALQNLLYLEQLSAKKTTPQSIRTAITQHMPEITDAKQRAGLFAERLLLNAREHAGRPLILMREGTPFGPDDLFVSYRHTIGAGIILLLSGMQPAMQKTLIGELMRDKVQNENGGWPIADRVYTDPDLLCSAHAAFYFLLAVQAGACNALNAAMEERRARTVAYLTLAAPGGRWTYGDPLGAIPFTARTYPEFVALLGRNASILVEKIPDTLLEKYPTPLLPHDHPFTHDNSRKTGIKNVQQLIVRLAYALKIAASRNEQKYVEKYILFRSEAINSYSDQEYYDTYDLCCLSTMLTDQFVVDGRSIRRDALYIAEPLLEVIPFFGKAYGITQKVHQRMVERGYLGAEHGPDMWA